MVDSLRESYLSQCLNSMLAVNTASVCHAKHNIGQCCKPGQQIKGLKNKANLLTPDVGKFITAETADLSILQKVLA